MGVCGNKATKQRRRQAPLSPSTTGGDVDLISGLGDDVLVRILELLPDERDAVTTGLLSRRWRDLWTRIPDLRFASKSWPEFRAASDARRFIDLVDYALARRAAQTEPAIESLAISLKLKDVRRVHDAAGRIVPPVVGAAQGWIRYAGIPAMILDNLPSSAKLETMRLAIGPAIVHLPSSVVFASLTDLSLECLVVVDGTAHLLSRLVSSACCPRLQKLRMRKIRFSQGDRREEDQDQAELIKIQANLLLELSLKQLRDPFSLDLTTPSLRGLRIEACCCLEDLTISTPNLERLNLDKDSQPVCIYIHDDELPSVRSLNVELYSHDVYADDEESNNNTIELLRCCTSLKYLEVFLQV
ncbi:hypothetical protein PR202_gb14385 [Eleusine coracana subsp. coracana]|uniref:F-box domain-containing protein n=1 Tax=Eleusine coracana subsp. coracana TaxID=191504 RepID=A0AAV5EW65_ELECO|nr:hypothetical protein PR202_gb14385 [Eleusine coracana subsp. coracana]